MGLGGCDSSFGTVSFVTGVFGLVAAGIVARIIAMQPTATDSSSATSDSSSTDNDADGSTSSTDAATASGSDSNDPAHWRWSHHALRNINKQKAAAVAVPHDDHNSESDAPTASGESTTGIDSTTSAASTISSSSSSTVTAGDNTSAVPAASTDSTSAVTVANDQQQQQQAVEPRLTGLYDAHCHLQMVASSSSCSAVRDEVTAAQAAGVVRAVVCATSAEDWAAVDTLATQVYESCTVLHYYFVTDAS
jgi:hypothetical protein